LLISTFVLQFLPKFDCEKKTTILTTNISKSWFKNYFFVFLILQHIQGISRNQVQMYSLEDKITTDLSVRFIYPFFKFIELKKLFLAHLNFQTNENTLKISAA
jgi:hypothetical protein